MQNIHPLFVHFPIALLSVAILFDILGYFLKKQSLLDAGFWTFALGVISAIITVVTGYRAEETVSLNQQAHNILETHQHFQTYSTAVFVGLLIWRGLGLRRGGLLPRPAIAYLIVVGLSVLTILYGAHYGGRLVYEYGVGTGVQPVFTKGVKGEQHQTETSALNEIFTQQNLLFEQLAMFPDYD